ncbi:MAG: hypothetical protein GY943_19360, partial [Chloroflexi bacterium]|nr:hypothetical protein [Chloroflexota bacterium]
MEQKRLISILNNYFNREELDALCFELGVEYRIFASHFHKDRIVEMLRAIKQENRFSELVQLVKQERPFLFNDVNPKTMVNNIVFPPSLNQLNKMDRVDLFHLVSAQFTNAELQTICIDLNIDETVLNGRTKVGNARALIVTIQDRNQMPKLRQRLFEHFSGANPIRLNQPPQKTKVPTEKLPALMFDNLTYEAFQKLCKKIKVDLEDIPRENDEFTELIYYLERRNRLSELVSELRIIKPNIPWIKVAKDFQPTQIYPHSFAEQIAYHFSKGELKSLVFDIGMNYENIIEPNQIISVQNLLSFHNNRKRKGLLLEALNRVRPFVEW